jgi:hypothetical protein
LLMLVPLVQLTVGLVLPPLLVPLICVILVSIMILPPKDVPLVSLTVPLVPLEPPVPLVCVLLVLP